MTTSSTSKPKDATTAKVSPIASPSVPRPDSKIGKVVALLQRKEGATLDELVTATGWQVHTARAALTGLKKRGYVIERCTRNDVSVYAIKAGS
ncbi:DUF3489 domain-containing protein [Altererythrobacter sp. GH1-8]|uniref:DUF3489 domain-containing protein n=1 Tax=Altererythrobacter sp. GH1-8 TaxID=3349333 RepID=UPI00374D6636